MAQNLDYFFRPSKQEDVEEYSKEKRLRLERFIAWLRQTGYHWLDPHLPQYRDYLLHETDLAETTVYAHISTIRAHYRSLSARSDFADYLRLKINPKFTAQECEYTREMLGTLSDPNETALQIERKTTDQYRLTEAQVAQLISLPGDQTLGAVRDAAIIGLCLATGVRAPEISGLVVSDLYHVVAGQSALFVRGGNGTKEDRSIPYGFQSSVLTSVERWLESADIHDGPMFRPLYKGNKRVRATAISTRGVEMVIANYPLPGLHGLVTVTPMMLRRTYARRLYEEGTDLRYIREYLGVGAEALMEYISAAPVPSSSRSTGQHDFTIKTDNNVANLSELIRKAFNQKAQPCDRMSDDS